MVAAIEAGSAAIQKMPRGNDLQQLAGIRISSNDLRAVLLSRGVLIPVPSPPTRPTRLLSPALIGAKAGYGEEGFSAISLWSPRPGPYHTYAHSHRGCIHHSDDWPETPRPNRGAPVLL